MMISSILFLVGLTTTASARLEKDMPKTSPKTVPLYEVSNKQWYGDLDDYIGKAMNDFDNQESKAAQKMFFNTEEYYARENQALFTLKELVHMTIRSCPRAGIEVMGVFQCQGSAARALVSRMGDLRDHDANIKGTAYDNLSLSKMFKKSKIAENGTGILAGNPLFKKYGIESVSCSYEKDTPTCVVTTNGPVRLSNLKIEVASADAGKAKRGPAIVDDNRAAKSSKTAAAGSPLSDRDIVLARKALAAAEAESGTTLSGPAPTLVPDAEVRK